MKTHETNPMLCDYETGICEIPIEPQGNGNEPLTAKQKPVQIAYFTDPICSSCWGIEPQLRKLKLEYGDAINIEYHMGGLLPSWNGYGGGGISKPSDVAHHWDEVSKHFDMPIDGDVWLEDPLQSSYPPSIAFIAAQLQDADKAQKFLRRIREMVFLEKKNITRWEHLEQAGLESGLNVAQLKVDYEGKAKELFEADLNFTRDNGVRGFPTLFFVNEAGQKMVVSGYKAYTYFEQAVQNLFPEVIKSPVDYSTENILAHYPTLTTKEFSVITGRTKEESEKILTDLFNSGILDKLSTKNGVLWKVRSSQLEITA